MVKKNVITSGTVGAKQQSVIWDNTTQISVPHNKCTDWSILREVCTFKHSQYVLFDIISSEMFGFVLFIYKYYFGKNNWVRVRG